MATPRPIVILGPTAGGKSDFAVDLAERFAPAEIISADSMQIYRHMDVGTAKPSIRLRERVPHHLIDSVEPGETFTVAHWLEHAERLMAFMQTRDVRPIVVGGTNLYLKALLEGLFEAPGQDAAFREQLADIETQVLHQRLAGSDPAAAERIHPNDRKRIIRALEVHHVTGQPISEQQTQWTDQDAGYRFNPILVGLHYEPAAINPRINLRVKAMFFPEKVEPEMAAEISPRGESLQEETARLLETGLLPKASQAAEALGYKQVLQHFAGEMTLDEAFEKTKILTRRFAKQQRTWLKRFTGVQWIDAANTPREKWQLEVCEK